MSKEIRENNLISISEERKRTLYELVSGLREHMPMSFLPLIRWLREHGEHLDIGELIYLQQRMGFRNEWTLPIPVASFYSKLINSRKSSKILDPSGGLGMLAALLTKNDHVQQMDAVTKLEDAEELITPLELQPLTVHIGDIRDIKKSIGTQYDAIVSIPPIVSQEHNQTVKTIDGTKIELHDVESSFLVVEVAELLSQNGFIALILPLSFVLNKKKNSVITNLEKFGLHLSALLQFRQSTFSATNMALSLVIIEKVNHGKLFVAEIPEDINGQDELITRLFKRQEGATPSQGRLIDENQFIGLKALEAKERSKKLGLGKGFEPIPFRNAVIEIRKPKNQGTNFTKCDDHPYAVYLPEMAATASKTRQEELPSKLKSYFQLIVNPDVVFPEYLSQLLNTPLGYAIRESSMTGTTVPRINKSNLEESILYLPPLSEQKKAVTVLETIQRLRTELIELEAEVWEKPRRISAINDALERVNHEERFEDWIESLPFPIASILRSYHARDSDDKSKYERLLHFFEGFAEFCSVIHLSAFSQSKVHWELQKTEIKKIMQNQHFSFEKPTFGLWVAVMGYLSSQLRPMLSGEEKTIANELYGTADSSILVILSSKSLISIMQRVNEYRNKWKGHGGAVTFADAEERHKILKKDLDKLRETIGTKFTQYQLIEALNSEIHPGPVYKCKFNCVMGSNPQLKSKILDASTPPIYKNLYFYNPGHDKLLALLPLIKLYEKSQTASFFYNRIDEEGSNLVCYHFNDESSMIEKSGMIQKSIRDLGLSKD